MVENIRSELFFLKQFGFNNTLLQDIFLLGIDPINIIFNRDTKYMLNWKKNLLIKTESWQKITINTGILKSTYLKKMIS